MTCTSSTNGTAKDILSILKEAPDELYELFEVREAPEEDCDYMADSGRCYSRK